MAMDLLTQVYKIITSLASCAYYADEDYDNLT